LWDILEGLRWVNRNIEYFGGDVRKITLAGESVGAMSVGFMSISPLAKGLYSRQIMESGAPNLFTLEAMKKMNVDLAQQLAKEVNCANDTFTIQKNPGPVVKCLKGVNSTVLSKADFRILPDSSLDFFPTFGDKLLPENPKRAVLSGNFHCTDLLMGNNEVEGSFQEL
ncbi:acetylcholinesterase, partial [Nephila pilipes]